MTWNESAYRRFKDQERTDHAVMQQHYAEQNKQRNKEMSSMSKHKTARGDSSSEFPDVSDRDDRIAKVRELMAEAYDTAEAEQNRRNRMEAASKPDTARFPALRTGAKR
jgi:hypothetical protein